MKFKILINALIIIVGLGFFTQDAFGIAAWARRYGVTCSACHVGGGWQLNKNGQDFLRYGHMYEGDKVGERWFDYFSFSTKVRFQGGDKELERFYNEAFSIYTGGPLGKGWSFFTEMYLHENSGVNDPAKAQDYGDFGRSKLAEAFIQYTHGKVDKYIAFRAGSIQPQLLHIHGLGARYSWSRPYILAGAKVGKNPYTPFSRQYGVEINGHYSNLSASAGVVNGTGFGGQFNMVDNNQYKDTYFTADFNFNNYGSRIGVYFYDGKYPLTGFEDKYHRIGLIGNWTIEKFSVMGAYLIGRNTIEKGKTADNSGFYVLGIFYPTEKFGIYARYDYFDPNKDLGGDEFKSPVGGFTCYINDWSRIVGEVWQTRVGSGTKKTSFVVEINLMF